MLAGKCIVVGVSGGIAAHRALDLTSSLVKAGAEVHVVMTAAACEFIRPLAFEALSGNYVHHDMFATPPGWRYPHLELARKADLAVIVPATADIIARLACGLADDLLAATVLAMTCPLLVCPAMNMYMFQNPAVQENLARLRGRDVIIVGPAAGRQACGDEGPGRLVAVAEILRHMEQLLGYEPDLTGLQVLITAGGT
ncbi:MAG: bifunctional 4'-phosphopantothenoylcysteine decarboxylase/phosphopantothenoylcysteine synthetase, partial [Firmicutes bacterium]|nr:bifunctional 4'-phosphopantothenoylcysteine decarboxylase/phosphopantothenoylcysteine synthetase [Bacillota bacterium]